PAICRPTDRRLRHPVRRQPNRMPRTFIGFPVVRSHQEWAAGNITEMNAMLDNGELIEDFAAALADVGEVRRDAECTIVHHGRRGQIAVVFETASNLEQQPRIALLRLELSSDPAIRLRQHERLPHQGEEISGNESDRDTSSTLAAGCGSAPADCRDSVNHGSAASTEPANVCARARQPPSKPPGVGRRMRWSCWPVRHRIGNGVCRILPLLKAGPRKLHGFTSPCTEIEQTCWPAPQVWLVWMRGCVGDRASGPNGSSPRRSDPGVSMSANSRSAPVYWTKLGIRSRCSSAVPAGYSGRNTAVCAPTS